LPGDAGSMAIPILGEWPSSIDWIAIALISTGVYVASGGPPPRRWATMCAFKRLRSDDPIGALF
jgi:hypothetical protein